MSECRPCLDQLLTAARAAEILGDAPAVMAILVHSPRPTDCVCDR